MLLSNAGPVHLAVLRIAVFGCWAIVISFFSPVSYATLPIELFKPWGIHSLFPEELFIFLLRKECLIFLKFTILIGCLLCVMGIRPFKPVAILTVILIFLFDFIVKGFNGFINHAQIAILFSAIFISFTPASDSLSVIKSEKRSSERNDYSTPVLLSAIVLTYAYSFIGIRRLYIGGFDVFTNDALVTYIIRNSLNYSMYGFEYGITLISFDYVVILFKAGFFIVTIMEILSPFIFFNRYLRYTWLSVIIPFHFISLFTMNIFFWENILLILVLFIGWDKVKFLQFKH